MFQFLQEYFEEQLTTVNGSYHVVKALKSGVVLINASLTSIIYQVGIYFYLIQKFFISLFFESESRGGTERERENPK